MSLLIILTAKISYEYINNLMMKVSASETFQYTFSGDSYKRIFTRKHSFYIFENLCYFHIKTKSCDVMSATPTIMYSCHV